MKQEPIRLSDEQLCQFVQIESERNGGNIIEDITARILAEGHSRRGSYGAKESGSSSQPEDTKPPFTIEALAGHLEAKGYKVRYNVISHEIDAVGTGLDAEHITENLSALLLSELRAEDCYKGVSVQVIESYLSVIALREKYNPVMSIFAQLEWDGVDRLGDIYDIMKLREDDKLSRTLVQKWLMQCVALSCFNDLEMPFGAEGILTLVGAQGIGKTSLIAKLGLNSRLCKLGANIDPHNKDDVLQSTACFICELGELESTMKRDIAALKAFITAHTDEVRKPYARAASKERRRTSFAATCNSRDFLNDPTGNRRFFTVPCKEQFDFGLMSRLNVMQIWAQMFCEVKCSDAPSRCFRLTPDEVKALSERNGAHTKTIPAEQEIRDILDDEAENKGKYEWSHMTVTDFASHYLSLNRYTSQQVGRALEQVGILPIKRKLSGTPVRLRYVPIPKKKQNIWE